MGRLNGIGTRARKAANRGATRLRGMVRRMIVTASSAGLWQVAGHEDEGDADVPAFQGIGYASRPSAASVGDGNPEAVILKIGGASGHPVIVATRDESIRISLAEDETAIFTSGSMVKIKADGTIEVGTQGGSFAPLALKSDVERFYTAITTAITGGADGGAAYKAAMKVILDVPPQVPVGTTKLKAE